MKRKVLVEVTVNVGGGIAEWSSGSAQLRAADVVREALAGVRVKPGIVNYEILPEGGPARDLQMAVQEIAEVIKRQLVLVPPMGQQPVQGLTEGLVLNLARTLAGCLEGFGRP